MGPTYTPTDLTAIPRSTSIDFCWSQPAEDLVEYYILAHHLIIKGCDLPVHGGTITGIDVTSHTFNLFGIEKNSEVDVTNIAVNGAGSSPEPARISTTTFVAVGMCNIVK